VAVGIGLTWFTVLVRVGEVSVSGPVTGSHCECGHTGMDNPNKDVVFCSLFPTAGCIRLRQALAAREFDPRC
jgi:hypothetical protein